MVSVVKDNTLAMESDSSIPDLSCPRLLCLEYRMGMESETNTKPRHRLPHHNEWIPSDTFGGLTIIGEGLTHSPPCSPASARGDDFNQDGDTQSSFGKRLRKLRQQRGLTQRELAVLVGLDVTYISKLERERVGPPARAAIVKIAETVGAEEEELMLLAGRASPQLMKQIRHSGQLRCLLHEGFSHGFGDHEWLSLREASRDLGFVESPLLDPFK